jgi:hypothetical protein
MIALVCFVLAALANSLYSLWEFYGSPASSMAKRVNDGHESLYRREQHLRLFVFRQEPLPFWFAPEGLDKSVDENPPGGRTT